MVLKPADKNKDVATDPNLMYRAEPWVANNRNGIGAQGDIGGWQATDSKRSRRGPMHMIFARYTRDSAQLAINVLRVERRIDGNMEFAVAQFTPHHGGRWVAARAHLTNSEVASGLPGFDPFAGFHRRDAAGRPAPDRSDANFHQVSWAAAQVVTGMAAQYYRSTFAALARVETGIATAQRNESSWGGLRSKTITTVSGGATTRWFLGTLAEAQPVTAQIAPPLSICIVDGPLDASGNPICADPAGGTARVVTSGLVFEQWQGGSLTAGLPAIEEVYVNVSEESQWNLLPDPSTPFYAGRIGAGDPVGGALFFLANTVPTNNNAFNGFTSVQDAARFLTAGKVYGGTIDLPNQPNPHAQATADIANARAMQAPNFPGNASAPAQLDAVSGGYRNTATSIDSIDASSPARAAIVDIGLYVSCESAYRQMNNVAAGAPLSASALAVVRRCAAPSLLPSGSP